MLTRKLFRTARSYKAQFISMIVMITIGIGIFLGFNIEWKSIEADTSEFFEETLYADYRLYSDGGFSEADIDAVKAIKGVDAATRYLSVNVGIKGTDKTVTLNVHEDATVSTIFPTSGTVYKDDADGIWLSDRFAEENRISIGDSLTFVYNGAEIKGTVIGLCKSGENMICTAGENQLMPDFTTHGFAYISPKALTENFGIAFYPQINIRSELDKDEIENAVNDALGKTILLTDKELHTAYAGAESEAQEGKTMGSVLPVLFLAIAVLTMVTTMHRIAANEKMQIGTLKALGYHDSRILMHYTSYGLFIGIVGCGLGVLVGYGIAAMIMSPGGMMSTYFDLPEWKLAMPFFCIPIIILTVVFLALISYFSTRKMLSGSAADALRPYTPKAFKRRVIEKTGLWNHLPFSAKWNLRDIMRHKARSAMTLLGVFGCTVLIVGGLGMKDTMQKFLSLLGDDVSNYVTKVNLSEDCSNEDAIKLSEELDGNRRSSLGINYNGSTITFDIYSTDKDKIRFLTEDNELMTLGDDGVYLCLRYKDTADIGDTIEFSPYGSETTYKAKVAGYFRSLFSESITLCEDYADTLGINYHISSVYTDEKSSDITDAGIISGKQDKDTIMASYDTFNELMDLMIVILIVAAVVLGIVVLYNLGIMSYVERRRELATLKVLGFRDKTIGRLLINQNIFLTVIGIVLGIPSGAGVLSFLVKELASEYELSVTLGPLTYIVSIVLTFAVSLFVGLITAGKCKKIDMVEALKNAE